MLEKSTALLLGPSGPSEKAVQSFGIFQKKLTAADPRPRLVIALRLRLEFLSALPTSKSCLGPCWEDGAITIGDSVSGVDSVQLPLTSEGQASRDHGNVHLDRDERRSDLQVGGSNLDGVWIWCLSMLV